MRTPTARSMLTLVLDALHAAVHAVAGALRRNEEQVSVDRGVALARGADRGAAEHRARGVGDIPDLEAAEVALEDEVALEREVGVGERQAARPALTLERGRLRVMPDERHAVTRLRRRR